MKEMESTAVNVKEKDTVSVVATADVAVIVSDVAIPIAVSDAIVPPIMVDKEMIVTTNDVDHVVVSKLAVITNETIITVNATSNNPGVEEDQFNLAMASVKISTNEVDEIKHNPGEKVLDEQQKLETATVEKDVVINENSDVYLDGPVKTKSSDGNEDYSKETKDPAAPAEPVVPVSVDDDTYDPQYIPKSGQFYEHNDRMEYNTTSSEGSESINGYDENSGDDNGIANHRSIKRRQKGIKKQKSVTPVDIVENTNLAVGDGRLSTKKILAISEVAATKKNSEFSVTADRLAKKLSVVFRKSRDLDALDKWPHDMYDENEQTRKSRDELLAYYGYDIREEIEAPRARHHHKYGPPTTYNTKYTRSWQETTAHAGAAGGQQSMQVKRGSMARQNVGGPNKNIKKSTTDEYTSEFLALDDTKKSEPTASNEPPAVVEVSGPSSLSSTNTKNYFNRPSTKTSISKEKGAHVNLDSPSASANLNFFKRKPQQNSGDQHHNNKQQHFNNGQGGQGHNKQHQNSSHSVSRGRNFHQKHTSPQYNRGRCFSKRPTPLSSSSSNQHNYDQQYHSTAPPTAGTAHTQHGGGHNQNFNNRQYEKKNQQVEPPPPPTPVVRSSKRFSVTTRREFPDPILNFGGTSKTPQPQPPAPHQQNLLVMQDQQMKPASQELLLQQSPAPLQTQQYHEPLQQIHHGMALDRNTGAAGGQQSMQVKRGSMARQNVGGPNKNIKKSTTDEYTSEFLALDDTKKSEPTASNEPPAVVEVSGPSSLSSTNTKNYFNRPSTKTSISKEKGAHVNLDSPSASANLNFFKRKPQQNSGDQHHNNKQQHFNNGQGGQGHNKQHQNSSHSVSRGRNFHQKHTSPQYNRGRCFSKRPTPLSSSSSNQHNYDQQYHSTAPPTAGTAHTQHGGGHNQNFNNRQYEKKNQQVEPPPPPTPVVRSSKRFSVTTRREFPDPILNFGGTSKTPQPQPPAPHQQNLLVMQDQQMKPASQELLLQQSPAPLQTQQYHEPLQQIHHGMALDRNTGAAGGQQSMQVKRGSMARQNVGGPNKNIKKSTTDEYTSEFLALDDTKKSEPTASNEPPAVVEVSGPSSLSSTNTKNYFNRPSTKTSISKEKGAHVNLDSPSASANLNFFKRKPQQNSGDQHHNNKQQHFNNGQGGQGHNKQHQNSSHSVSRGRNFHQKHTSPQYNRGRCFSKRPTPLSSSSSNQHNYDQQYHSTAPPTAGTAHTQHGGGHNQNFNNRQYEKKNQQVEPPPPPTPVVRSSKRFSVTTRREFPDPILNFGGTSKPPQPQPPVPHQQNLLVMQDQQMKPASQELLQQQSPAPLQTQQYHEPLQQIHHGMALDRKTDMMVMTAADPSSAENQNAVVFQPVPTGATGVTSLPSGTQSLQQPETFMATTYQQQQLPQQQPPPRSVNLAMPIEAPPPEPHQQLGA